MMKHLINLTIFTFILNGSAIFAGEVGNGGDVVVCGRPSDQTITLLDYYEASKLRDITIDLGDENLSVEEKIEIALKRLERFSPSRAARYRERISNFDAEAKMIPNATLTDIPDSGDLVLENGCKIEQLVVQQDPLFPEDKRYKINKDLWDHMNNTQRAGTKLHEVIYYELTHQRNYKQENSIRTRYLNSMISSKSFETFSQLQWNDLYNRVGFIEYDAYGMTFYVDPCTQTIFHKNGLLATGFVKEHGTYNWNGNPIPVYQVASFYENGNPEHLIVKDSTLPIGGSIWSVVGNISFDSDGHIIQVERGNFPERLIIGGREWTSMGNLWSADWRSLEFFPNGVPKTIRIAKPQHLDIDGLSFEVEREIKFYENGALKYAEHNTAHLQRSTADLEITAATTFFANEKIESVVAKSGSVQFHGKVYRVAPNSKIYFSNTGEVEGASFDEFTSMVWEDKKIQVLSVREENGVMRKLLGKNSIKARIGESRLISFQFKNFEYETYPIAFYPNGRVESGIIGEDLKLLCADDQTRDFPQGILLEFNEEGKVTKAADRGRSYLPK
jgi:hypothetical protein